MDTWNPLKESVEVEEEGFEPRPRIQQFAVLLSLVMQFILPPLSVIVSFLLLLTNYWPLPLLYLTFINTLDREISTRGGRPLPCLRSLSLWKHVRDYFPIKLVRTCELDATRNYIFAFHPHGIIVAGGFLNFATEATGFSKLFPGITPHLLVLKLLFRFPLFRDLYLGFGMCDVSKDSIRHLCSNEGGGNASIVVVGGAAEALDARPGSCTLHLKNRKGFIRMALLTGTDLVPVYSFGENDVFDQPSNPIGSPLRHLQDKIRSWLTFSPVLPYAWGIMPYRRRICTVVGAPIKVVQQTHPTAGDVNLLHDIYVRQLKKLFDTHKRKYSDYPDAQLIVL